MKFSIPVQLKTKQFKVELWFRNVSVAISAESKPNSQTRNVEFERSISGQQVHTTLTCDYLPQIQMSVILPEKYPSESKPKIHLSTFWLNEVQLDKLVDKLNELWDENFNTGVLFTWYNWIEENLLEYLEISDENNVITLNPAIECKVDLKNKENFDSTFVDKEDFIYKLLTYNFYEELEEFKRTPHCCTICVEVKLGNEFFRLNNCKHHFCFDCMESMCQMHVQEGTIQLLKFLSFRYFENCICFLLNIFLHVSVAQAKNAKN